MRKRKEKISAPVAQTNTHSHIITHAQHKRALHSRIHGVSSKTHFKMRKVAPVFKPILWKGLVSSVGESATK